MSQSTAERLQAHYPFDPDVLDTVSEFVDRQHHYLSYREFFADMSIGENQIETYNGLLPAEVLDIRPKDHDESRAMVVHLPMANPLDSNQRFQVASLAVTNPNTRVIAFANPSGPGFRTGLLTHKQRKAVAQGDFRPVVEPQFRYLDAQNITSVHEVGASYGVDTATAAAEHANYTVEHLTGIEPADVVKRGLLKLGNAFKSTEAALAGYIGASDLQTLSEEHADAVGGNAYVLGLGRLSNIAVARGIARGDLSSHIDTALQKQKEMHATLIWGSESELALDAIVSEIVNGLDPERVKAMRLPGQKHALADDIPLQAALVLQSRR